MAGADPVEDAPQDVHVARLTKGMEHMRAYVSVPSTHSPSTLAPVAAPDAAQDLDTNVYGVPSSAINPPRKPASLDPSQPKPEKRTDPFQFGSRFLEEGDDIFSYNAWDHVEVDDAFKEFAELQYQKQREAPVSDVDKKRFTTQPSKWWNKFYTNNTTNFFKDRKWLFQEFPVLRAATFASSTPVTILELGAGAGNTAFPILKENKNKELRLHACDFSAKAVELIRAAEEYDGKIIRADVWDVAAEAEGQASGISLPPGLGPASVDIVIMIFIFSALSPAQWAQALRNVYAVLKPGGQILFRDYGRGDLAQVRFKTGRWLEENFYVRGDGTRVYFFEKEELEMLFGGAGDANFEGNTSDATHEGPKGQTAAALPKLEIVNLAVDRRMLVNRQRRLKMYRCWMQGQFKKPDVDSESTTNGNDESKSELPETWEGTTLDAEAIAS